MTIDTNGDTICVDDGVQTLRSPQDKRTTTALPLLNRTSTKRIINYSSSTTDKSATSYKADFSNITDINNASNSTNNNTSITHVCDHKRDSDNNVASFVAKLYEILETPENRKYIKWNDNGDVFMIFHAEEFAKIVLPKYFKHSRFSSFVRQLNIYGFYRVTDARKSVHVRNKEVCVFSHNMFLKGRINYLSKIKRRVPRKGSSVLSHTPPPYYMLEYPNFQPSNTNNNQKKQQSNNQNQLKLTPTSSSQPQSVCNYVQIPNDGSACLNDYSTKMSVPPSIQKPYSGNFFNENDTHPPSIDKNTILNNPLLNNQFLYQHNYNEQVSPHQLDQRNSYNPASPHHARLSTCSANMHTHNNSQSTSYYSFTPQNTDTNINNSTSFKIKNSSVNLNVYNKINTFKSHLSTPQSYKDGPHNEKSIINDKNHINDKTLLNDRQSFQNNDIQYNNNCSVPPFNSGYTLKNYTENRSSTIASPSSLNYFLNSKQNQHPQNHNVDPSKLSNKYLPPQQRQQSSSHFFIPISISDNNNSSLNNSSGTYLSYPPSYNHPLMSNVITSTSPNNDVDSPHYENNAPSSTSPTSKKTFSLETPLSFSQNLKIYGQIDKSCDSNVSVLPHSKTYSNIATYPQQQHPLMSNFYQLPTLVPPAASSQNCTEQMFSLPSQRNEDQKPPVSSSSTLLPPLSSSTQHVNSLMYEQRDKLDEKHENNLNILSYTYW